MVGDVEDKGDCGRLIIMLDGHGDDIQEYQSEDCDLKSSGH